LIADWRKPYPSAADNLEEHLERLLSFYDYPSGHWKHLRTSNVIESLFTAVRLRTDAAKRFRTVWRPFDLAMIAEAGKEMATLQRRGEMRASEVTGINSHGFDE
jgi:transposase-like protein